jgi:hypothetical protein
VARSEEKGAKAVEALREEIGNKNIELLLLDLADIKEVSLAAYSWLARYIADKTPRPSQQASISSSQARKRTY